eukprot:m.233757 g.233757  ORF g.233757 m.233757 type:complete len:315 (-) comp19301_c0_seq10:225-1169(-)
MCRLPVKMCGTLLNYDIQYIMLHILFVFAGNGLGSSAKRLPYKDAHYFPEAKVLMCVLPKAGSSSFFDWLYTASTGGTTWNSCPSRNVGGYDHPSSTANSCWERSKLNMVTFGSLPREEQIRIATSDEVFRFSLAREPVSRAISGWKSKLACPSTGFHVDSHDTPRAIRGLYRLTQSPYLLSSSCLSLEQFSDEMLKIKQSGKMDVLQTGGMVQHFASASLMCSYDDVRFQQIALLETFKFTHPNVQLRYLADRLNLSLEEFPYGHQHQSTEGARTQRVKKLNITESVYNKLRETYAMDYTSMGDVLHPGLLLY